MTEILANLDSSIAQFVANVKAKSKRAVSGKFAVDKSTYHLAKHHLPLAAHRDVHYGESIMRVTPVWVAISWLFLSMVGAGGAETVHSVEMKVLRMDNGLRFGLIGQRKDRPAPSLIVLGHSLETMQQEPVYTEVARLLAPRGVLSVVLDPPCHGETRNQGSRAAWRVGGREWSAARTWCSRSSPAYGQSSTT